MAGAWGRADPAAVVAGLFDRHATELVRLARLFVDDRDAAEDLVQEAFIRLHRSLHRIDQDDRVLPYLRSILLNLARDHNRRGLLSLRHRSAELSLAQRDRLDDVELSADQADLLEAVRSLPRRQRDCLVLRYYLDMGPPEIAETLAMSVNSVKTHLRRGLAALGQRPEVQR